MVQLGWVKWDSLASQTNFRGAVSDLWRIMH